MAELEGTSVAEERPRVRQRVSAISGFHADTRARRVFYMVGDPRWQKERHI